MRGCPTEPQRRSIEKEFGVQVEISRVDEQCDVKRVIDPPCSIDQSISSGAVQKAIDGFWRRDKRATAFSLLGKVIGQLLWDCQASNPSSMAVAASAA